MPADISTELQQTVEVIPVLPLTMQDDSLWVSELLGSEQDESSIAELSSVLGDVSTSRTTAYFEMGIFTPEGNTRAERTLRRGELADPLDIVRVLRVLSRNGISARDTIDNTRTIDVIKKPVEALSLLQEAEGRGEIGIADITIVAEDIVRGVIRNHPTQNSRNRKPTNRLTTTNSHNATPKTEVSEKHKEFLKDPANQEKAKELLELGFNPAECLHNLNGKLSFVDKEKLVELHAGLVVQLPEIDESIIMRLTYLISRSARSHTAKSLLEKISAVLDLADTYGFNGVHTLLNLPSITAGKTETIKAKLDIRIDALTKIGLSRERIMQLVSSGDVKLDNSPTFFNLGITILSNLNTNGLANTSESSFGLLIGKSARSAQIVYSALQYRDLSKITLEDFFKPSKKAEANGVRSNDFRNYIESNRDKFSESPIHHTLLVLYDEIQKNIRVKAKQDDEVEQADREY